MKIARYDGSRIGIVHDETVHDATDWIEGFLDHSDAAWGDPLVRALPAILAAGPPRTGAAHDLADVKLASPVRRPSKIIAAPNNYAAHLAEMAASNVGHGRTSGNLDSVGLFLKANSSLVGPDAGIKLRFPDARTDHEVELVAIIGAEITGIDESAALSAVAAYAVGLDITLRGPQERSLRKSIDGYTVLGPYLVTADEVGAPTGIDLALTLDDEVKQQTSTDDMVDGVAALVAYCARFYTLYPGDLIYTGTCAGVGPIRPGNVLVASASRVGSMRVAVR